jgi:hypothetical protein
LDFGETVMEQDSYFRRDIMEENWVLGMGVEPVLKLRRQHFHRHQFRSCGRLAQICKTV